MVKLNKIYTRTGDKGTTGLATGERREKFDLRVEAYGTIDEANAALGLAVNAIEDGTSSIKQMLLNIQNDLFDLGADLSTPKQSETIKEAEGSALRITQPQVTRLETEIDKLNEELQPLKSFILPGGNKAASFLHLARTITRRAERQMVELERKENEIVSNEALQYINRLSDLLFVLSRYLNDKGAADILWTPGANR